MQRTDLKPFDKMRLMEIRELRSKMAGGGKYSIFLDELKNILEFNPPSEEWEQMEYNGIVLGEIWRQSIGEFRYKRRLHKFEYLYVPEGLVMSKHRHHKLVNKGNQLMYVKEWTIFPDGKIEMCDKQKVHVLMNHYKVPIYVVCIQAMSNTAHY